MTGLHRSGCAIACPESVEGVSNLNQRRKRLSLPAPFGVGLRRGAFRLPPPRQHLHYVRNDFLDTTRKPLRMGHRMAESGYIVAVDQGTTGTTAALVDSAGRLVWKVAQEIRQIYPRPGWVEHDPEEIFGSCLETIEELLEESEVSPRQVIALGITNQRETTVVWERDSGKPVTNAIVWQCRRTAPLCEAMKARGMEGAVKKKTGLPVDAYFSGTKLRWILDNVPDGQRRAERGELLFGTVDSWLLWNFSNGTTHATDPTNASRTMLFGIDALAWDDELLRDLDIPSVMLPQVAYRSAGALRSHSERRGLEGRAGRAAAAGGRRR